MESFGNFNNINNLDEDTDPLIDGDPMDVLADDNLIFDDDDDVIIGDIGIGLIDEEDDDIDSLDDEDDPDSIIKDSYDDSYDF